MTSNWALFTHSSPGVRKTPRSRAMARPIDNMQAASPAIDGRRPDGRLFFLTSRLLGECDLASSTPGRAMDRQLDRSGK